MCTKFGWHPDMPGPDGAGHNRAHQELKPEDLDVAPDQGPSEEAHCGQAEARTARSVVNHCSTP